MTTSQSIPFSSSTQATLDETLRSITPSLAASIKTAAFSIVYFLYSFVQLAVLLLIPRKTFHRIYRGLDEKEMKSRISSMGPWCKPGTKLLDVGAGSAKFGMALVKQFGVEVVGVDVVDYADSPIPFFVYDGKKLPFEDQSFDVVFAAFVLHHCTNQTQLLSELKRCSRKYVIVFEDTYSTKVGRLFTAWNDFHTNILQGWVKVLKGYAKPGVTEMPMPLTFRSPDQWIKVFNNLSLKVNSMSFRKTSYKPLTKVTFVLESREL